MDAVHPTRVRRKVEVPPFKRKLRFEKGSKCYTIELHQRGGKWELVTHRGKVGGKLRPLIERFDSFEAAHRKALKRAKDRLYHGYEITHID